VGIDGSTITLPSLASSVTPPVVAGGNVAFVPSSQVEDPEWKPGSHNQWDFTIQRELPGHSRLEVGYVGHTARNIYQISTRASI
jgi:outer membrane receptor protein involved in Fe transport